MSERIITHAAASIDYAAGVLAFIWQTGEFSGVLAEVVAGIVNIDLQADCGIDQNESAIIITPRTAAGVGVLGMAIHTTDVQKQVQLVSVAGGFRRTQFDITIFRRLIV
jgi:hypothetical protein